MICYLILHNMSYMISKGVSLILFLHRVTLTKMHDVVFYYGEWLLFNANSAIFQLYHGENKLTFDEKMMRSALY